VPFIVSWPARLKRPASAFRRQYCYVTDVLPTLADLIGLRMPTERNGKPLKPIAGTSFAATLADPDLPSRHTEQYVTMFGNRGYYRDGWEAVTLHRRRSKFSADRWELYNLQQDPTETRDLSAQHPEKVAALVEAWEE